MLEPIAVAHLHQIIVADLHGFQRCAVIGVILFNEEELAEQVIANMEKIANDCIHCEYFCETCGRCSIPDDEIEEVPCRCKGCPDLCKEKGVCMRGEDI